MSTATHRLHKLARLSSAERRWLAAALLSVIAGHLVLRLLPYALWSYLLRPSHNLRPRTSQSPAFIAIQISRAARLIPRSTCLVQAIAAQLILRPCGHRARIVIGIKQPLAAHAWVTDRNGEVIIGRIPDIDRYVPFPTETHVRSLK